MESLQQQMVEAKKRKGTKALKKAQELCKEHGFTAGARQGGLPEGSAKK